MAGIADLKGTYVLDPSHSQVGFIARHAMVTKVRGTFNEVDGTATFDGSNPSSSSLTVAIKTASVDTRNEGRDAHLQSADFFDAETYPEITFVGTGFAVSGDVLEVTSDDAHVRVVID